TLDDLRLDDVEPAAEGDDLDAHQAVSANSSAANRPSCSSSTGPVIITWPSLSRHSISRSPPGRVMRTLRPVSPLRGAATATAQAAEPQARVRPAPRSHTLTITCSGLCTAASEMLARSGKIGWFSSSG